MMLFIMLFLMQTHRASYSLSSSFILLFFVSVLLPRCSCSLIVSLVSTFLIVGIAATASTSREAVLNPPDEETEKSEKDEEDDYDDGDDDVAFHCCGFCAY